MQYRYETVSYLTRYYPGLAVGSPPGEDVILAEGWRRVWADVRMDGQFVVYARETKTDEETAHGG